MRVSRHGEPYSRGVARRRIGAVVVLTLLFWASFASTAYGLKVGPNPSSLSLTEGDSQLVTFRLDAPIIAITPNPDVTVNFTVDDPTRVTLSVDSLVWPANEWSQMRSLTVNALEDGVHNDTNTVTVHYIATSASEYYNNFSGSLSVTLADLDPAPTTTTIAPSTTSTVAPTTTAVVVAPSSTSSTPAPLPRTGTTSNAGLVGLLFVGAGSTTLALSHCRRRHT